MRKPVVEPPTLPTSFVSGFTLIELMIVVAIVAILAAIALPNYSDYVKRGKIMEATTGLSDARQRMEQYFLDTRTYVGGCAAVLPAVQSQIRTFTLKSPCPVETVSTYTLQADGNAANGMGGFQYQVDETGAKKTTGVPSADWGSPPISCWVVRKGGGCI